MPLADVTLYELSVWLHITAVVVGFGATFAEALAFPVAMQMSPRHFPYVHRLQLAINRFLATPALVIVLATGVFQTIDGDWEFEDFWISASLLIVILLGAILGGYFIPTDRRLATLAEQELAAAGPGEVTMSEEYQRQAGREGVFGTVSGVLIIAAIFLMVTKLGA